MIFTLLIFSCKNSKKIEESKVEDNVTVVDEHVRKILDLALSDSTNEDINTNLTEINDEETAIRAVEPILFYEYGKENILEQKPYKISRIDNYWIIEGIQKEPHPGGVFHLVLESKNGTIIYLIHGK